MPSDDCRISRSCLSAILILFGLAALPLAGCLFAPPYALDESVLVFNNPLVTGELPWWKAITGYHYYQYTPITFLSHRLNAWLFGLEDAAWSFRLVNWLIHGSSACVLWRLLNRLGFTRGSGLLVACAWAAHPMACENVSWIAERSNAFAFLFGVVSMWAYVKWYGRWQGILWSTLAFSAALLSKPLALGWLPIFVALELLGGPKRLESDTDATKSTESRNACPWGWAELRLLPLIVVALVLLVVGLDSYSAADRPPPGGTWFTALLTDTGLFLRYAWNTLIPIHLSAMYAIHDITSLADARLWLNVVVWIFFIGGSCALAGSRRRALFGWLWFFGGLGPACNIIAIGYPMQDRYAYLSSAGLLLVVVEVAMGLGARGRLAPKNDGTPEAHISSPASETTPPSIHSRRTFVGPVLGALYVSFLAILTLQRAPLWGDNLELMRQAVECEPDGALPHLFYAKELELRARRIEKDARIFPPEARVYREAAAKQVLEGMQKADAYVHDPLPTILMLARNWALGGKPREAVDLLEKSLPDPAKYSIVSRHGLRYMIIPEERFGFPYSISLLTLADGHFWLGEAYLACACEAHPGQAPALLDHVEQEAQKALGINPAFYEAYGLLSKEFLLREALSEDNSPEGLAIGRSRLVLAMPQLEKMGRMKEFLSAFSPPIPRTRVPALGCLAMAYATRAAAEIDGTQDRFAKLRDSLEWAKRSSAFDPGFGESFWFQSDLLLSVRRSLPGARPKDSERIRMESIKALESIATNSPRYAKAQQLIQALKAESPPR